MIACKIGHIKGLRAKSINKGLTDGAAWFALANAHRWLAYDCAIQRVGARSNEQGNYPLSSRSTMDG
jgi:hypothetical protein